MSQLQNEFHYWHQGKKHLIAHEVLTITHHTICDVLGCFFEWLTASSSCLKDKWTAFSFPLLERVLQRGDRNEANDKGKKPEEKPKKQTNIKIAFLEISKPHCRRIRSVQDLFRLCCPIWTPCRDPNLQGGEDKYHADRPSNTRRIWLRLSSSSFQVSF